MTKPHNCFIISVTDKPISPLKMKEDQIKTMSDSEIKNQESVGNKEQVKHFRKLVEQSEKNQ